MYRGASDRVLGSALPRNVVLKRKALREVVGVVNRPQSPAAK